ncbi:MAG TPA: hypothetical protein VN476_02335 [Pyrinomonadaceae bacterium]|nr:hypothetical protein [Pyrinomonadaceae bacterium]
MKFFDPNNPNEKKKMIAAAVLALVAIVVLGYVFFGGSSSAPNTNKAIARSSPTPRINKGVEPPPDAPPGEDLTIYKPVVCCPGNPAVGDADRNIFAFYEPPPPTPKPVYVPTPTPTPTPPVMVSSLSPTTVVAGTPSDFSLQVNGDKFTPAVHIYIDGRDVPTRFINSQQLFATVSQTLIKNAGVRQIMARSSDGKLYSNTISLNVSQPEQPNFTYVGIIGKPRFNDTAVLQDKGNKEFVRVQRGDSVGRRFRVVSISEKEVVLIDATLKIPFRLPFTADQNSNTGYRPPARSTDDEP